MQTQAITLLALVSAIFSASINAKDHAIHDSVEQTSQGRASYIQLTAQPTKVEALAEFLGVGAKLVDETEPGTQFWAALQSQDKKNFIIFDTFATQAAQDAHFAGKIPQALSAKAHELVVGGWQEGVLPNIHNADIIASKTTADAAQRVKIATFIPIVAKAGQEANLVALLEQGAKLVTANEPDTLYWYAIHFGGNRYGIIDFFPNQQAVDHHFGGEVAAAVKQHASLLIEGGWEQGVVEGIEAFRVFQLVTH